MAHSTGKNCEAIKKIINSDDSVTDSHIKGMIEYIDNLDEKLQKELERSGCDWPVFVQKSNHLKIYFSCCCKEGSVVVLELTTKLAGHVEILRSLFIQEAGKSFQKSA